LEQARLDLTYWTLKAPALPLGVLDSWQQQSYDIFKQLLIQAADQFPSPFGLAPEKQAARLPLCPWLQRHLDRCDEHVRKCRISPL